MKSKAMLTAIGLAAATASASSVAAAQNAHATTAKKPSAEAILRQMSGKLAAAHQFSFEATRNISAAAASQKGLQAESRIKVLVRRPHDVVATSTSDDAVRSIFFDGQHFTMVDGKENMYSTVPLHASLDALPAVLAAKYGLVPPLAEFVISNPYKDLHWRAQKISYVGTEPCPAGSAPAGPGDCYRLLLTGTAADAEYWIAASDKLPRRVTSTLKGEAAGASVNIVFTGWNLKAPAPEHGFAFAPPAGAVAIPMVTTADIEKAAKKQP